MKEPRCGCAAARVWGERGCCPRRTQPPHTASPQSGGGPPATEERHRLFVWLEAMPLLFGTVHGRGFSLAAHPKAGPSQTLCVVTRGSRTVGEKHPLVVSPCVRVAPSQPQSKPPGQRRGLWVFVDLCWGCLRAHPWFARRGPQSHSAPLRGRPAFPESRPEGVPSRKGLPPAEDRSRQGPLRGRPGPGPSAWEIGNPWGEFPRGARGPKKF